MTEVKPRVLFVGHTHYQIPVADSLEKKWSALEGRLEVRVVGAGADETSQDDRFRLLRECRRLRSVAFFSRLPGVVASEIQGFRPDVIIAQGPYEGLAVIAARSLVRAPVRLIIEAHGDWRTAARLYGSSARRIFAPVADAVAIFALRRADATRALSRYTADLVQEATGRDPLAVFPTYSDAEAFSARSPQPLPHVPTVLWIGVLQKYKDPAALAAAWRIVAGQLSEARLVIVGKGPLQPIVDRLVARYPSAVETIPYLTPTEVSRRLDNATVLALPSRSEGYGRVIVEAFMRGRPVVASSVGGILDLVISEQNGLLVPPQNPEALAQALLRVLGDRGYASGLGAQALNDAKALTWTSRRYADAVYELVERTLAAP
jgi:glycosyltransferase involved in cell wall biosynthesis